MPSAFYPPTRPSSVGEVLDLAFGIFKATLVKSLPYGICAVVAQWLPNIYDLSRGAAIHSVLDASQSARIVIWGAGVLLALMAWSALLLRQRALIEHRPTSMALELSEAMRRLPSFLLATALFLVVVAGGFAVLTVLPPQYRPGLRFMLIVLGMYFAVLLSCTWPAVLLARHGPLGALRLSTRLVWGNWWRTAAVYAVGGVVVAVVSILVGALITAIVSALGAGITVSTSVFMEVSTALGAVMAPFAGALLLATFGDLRVRKEGTDLQQRVAGLAVE